MTVGAGVRRKAERYRFDGIVVDAVARTLVRDGGIQQVAPKAFSVLLELLRHPGELLDRNQLLDAVWEHRRTPGELARAISQLRIALNDNPLHPRYIQARHALGYRFIGTLQAEAPPASGAGGAAEGTGMQARRVAAARGRKPLLWLLPILLALLMAAALIWGNLRG